MVAFEAVKTSNLYPLFLDEDIQQGPHDSVEDASTAMGIYRKVTGK